MISQKLVDAVYIEAAKLKENATKEELAKLDFDTFSSSSPDECIYGQVTGSCDSRRAHALIRKCAPLVVRNLYNQPCQIERGKKTGLTRERDHELINRIHENKALDRIWRSLSVEAKRKVLGFAEGDEKLAALALQEAKEKE